EVWVYSYASSSSGAMSLVAARVVVGPEATPGEREERVRDYVRGLAASGYERGGCAGVGAAGVGSAGRFWFSRKISHITLHNLCRVIYTIGSAERSRHDPHPPR